MQPGNARKFLASKTCFACSAWISGARRATFPSLTAMSRQSTDVLLGRTTRAFLITRSNGLSIPGFLLVALRRRKCFLNQTNGASDLAASPTRASLAPRRRWRRFVPLAEREHLRRPDQFVEHGEVEHAGTKRLGRSAGGKRGVIVARRARQGAHDAAGKDHEREADRLELGSRQQRGLAALHHIRHQRHA